MWMTTNAMGERNGFWGTKIGCFVFTVGIYVMDLLMPEVGGRSQTTVHMTVNGG